MLKKEQILSEVSRVTQEIEATYNIFLEIRGNQAILQRDESVQSVVKEILEKFPERRVHEVLGGLANTRTNIIDDFAKSIDNLTPPA